MNQGFRRAAVGIPGFCAFLNLYAPQSLLPLLAQEFAATPADISLTMTATALAIAITAPFAGAIADVLGRKRVIVAAMMLLAIPTVDDRFRAEPARADLLALRAGPGAAADLHRRGRLYRRGMAARARRPASPASTWRRRAVGGFCGRFFSGLLADTIGWRNGFLAFAAVTFACGLAVAAILPRERNFVRSEGLAASARQMLGHLRNPRLLATYAVGFGTLFNFVALFTYVNFVLAAPPFNLSPTLLGAIFVTYLAGSVVVLWLGRAVARFGRRTLIIGTIARLGLRRAAHAWSLALGDHRAGSRSRRRAASSPRRPRPPMWR